MKHRERVLKHAVVFCLFAFGFATQAGAAGRDWKRIVVPGAHCGDGSEYPIYVSAGDPKKVAFDIMGGGACWNLDTCYATPTTFMHALPFVWEPGGFISTDPSKSPVHDYTIVYFPYCTGDVHAGGHVATLAPAIKYHHEGRSNFERSVQTVVEKKLIDLDHAEKFVLYGYSAGGIGALIHSFDVEPLVRKVPEKFLIADAPGLHFGPQFWDKFPPEMLRDFQLALGRVGFDLRRGQGNLAGVIPEICHRFPDWKVGVLQGARDIIMSSFFGSISMDDHEKLIYGPEGLFTLTEDPNDNCSAWVPRSAMHTFLTNDETAAIESKDGVSAMEYVRRVIEGADQVNYR